MPRIVYQYIASGQNDVIAAFKSTATAAREAERAQAGLEQRRVRSTRKATDETFRQVANQEKAGYRTAARRESEIDREAKAVERAHKQIRNSHEKTARERRREDNRSLHAFQQRERAEERMAGKRAMQRSEVAGRVVGGAVVLAADVAMAGGAIIGSAARESIQLGEASNRIAINARAAGQTDIDPKLLKRQFEDVAISTPGVKSQDVAGAALAYQSKTGTVLGPDQLQALATASSAAGADIVDMSNAMAAMSEKFDVKSIEDVKTSMAGLIEQGAKGAFEIKDAAAQFDRLTSAAGSFGIGQGPEAVKRLFGFAQLAKQGTGTARMATTAMENVFSGLSSKAEFLKGHGVEAFFSEGEKKGQARPFQEVLIEAVAKIGGSDLVAKRAGIEKAFGKQGKRAMDPLLKTYIDSMAEGKSVEQAMVSMREQFDKTMVTTASWTDVQEQAKLAQSDASAQITGAWEQIKSVTSDKLVPALLPLISELPKLIPALFPLIDAFVILAEMIDIASSALEKIPGFEASPALQKRKAERDLRKAKEGLKEFDIIGPLSADQMQQQRILEEQKATAENRIGAADIKATQSQEQLKKLGVPDTALGRRFIEDSPVGQQFAKVMGAAGPEYKARLAEQPTNMGLGFGLGPLPAGKPGEKPDIETNKTNDALSGFSAALRVAAGVLESFKPAPTVAPIL